MSVHLVKDKYVVFKGEKVAEAKFRTELSMLILNKFGKGPFDDQEIVLKIVTFSLDYYIDKFKGICLEETSVRFYQNIFWFHEQATELAFLYAHQDISPDISKEYIAQYRRILKFILEVGCEVQMVTGENADKKFRERMEPMLHDLLFLGEMILMCVDLYAENTMIEDVIDISFDMHGLYLFSRRHHYEFIFEHMIKEMDFHAKQSIIDENGFDHFREALKDCFGINYEDVGHLIASIHKELEHKGGEMVGVGWETLPSNLHNLFGVPEDIAEKFFRGLRLDETNKMDLSQLICKPYNLNRYLYRPIIIWNVDGKDFAFFGKNSWTETIFQYYTNAIPWGKSPKEWMEIECFKKYVNKKGDEHDKWLENFVEEKLQNQRLLYDKNVKHLKSSMGTTNINVPGLGEIDFIIVAKKVKKIFIAECKHLIGRYDIVNQKNDYNSFTVGSTSKKSFNQTMKNKLIWFNENIELVQEHFQVKYSDPQFSLNQYSFEGIFIVNTPTLYMYNSEYRIYTIAQIEKVLTGEFIDPTFLVVIEGEEFDKILNVKYPYFQKPTYLTFDPFSDENGEE